jgi:hypothetical protein
MFVAQPCMCETMAKLHGSTAAAFSNAAEPEPLDGFGLSAHLCCCSSDLLICLASWLMADSSVEVSDAALHLCACMCSPVILRPGCLLQFCKASCCALRQVRAHCCHSIAMEGMHYCSLLGYCLLRCGTAEEVGLETFSGVHWIHSRAGPGIFA